MDQFLEIYTRQADEYHRLIQAEDASGNLLPALRSIAPVEGSRLLDLGTGTGRIPLLLAGLPSLLVGLDLQQAMLGVHRKERMRLKGDWDLVQGDMVLLPCASQSFDVVTAGWAIGHLRTWHAGSWRSEISHVLLEMERIAVHGGTLIILETLGTGQQSPRPPTRELAEYYAWLEAAWNYRRRAVRTDYVFASVREAIDSTEFFFGRELSSKIQQHGWARIPEWTGIWSKRANKVQA